MTTLFNGDNSDSDAELKINTDYAKNYNNWRQKEVLNKLKAKYGDINENETSDRSSESESSSEEEENELTQQFDKDFYKTLALLKNKDPKIYNQGVTFFDDTNKTQELLFEKKKEKAKKEETVFLRDYERKLIIEKEGKLSDSEDESILKKNREEFKSVTYVQEQEQLKESFKVALNDKEEDDELLRPKTKSESEKQKEEADYKEWLKGQKVEINENEQELLKPLRDFWTNPNLDANERFLRDYVLHNKYLDNDYAVSDENTEAANGIHDSDENLSEDEKNIEKQEEFEHKYNFRFEEPDQEFLKRYPRTMENSLRRKDTRRAEKRAEVKKRKEEDKIRKKEELKQLKALKRKEIEEKIEKLKEITGNDDVQFNDIDLEGDFDPAEYDKKMTQIFNEDYYAAPEGDAKPEFPDIDEELEIEDTWDNYDPNDKSYAYQEGHDEPHCEDPDFNMDADYDGSKKIPDEIEGSKRRKRRRKSKFAELIAKEKPKFDPQQYKSYEDYFDKYYSLDYEDMIGDIPCRFKYRKVVPNDYGLSVEEILMADDKELNKWCSLKKALQYKSEHAELNDVQMYKQKAKNEAAKQKILRSLFTEPEEEEKDKEEVAGTTAENGGAKKRRRKKKKQIRESHEDASSTVVNREEPTENNKSQKKSGEKRKQPENHTEQPKKKERGESHEDSSSTKVNHEGPTENNKTQKKSGEKLKQPENHTKQPKKKERGESHEDSSSTKVNHEEPTENNKTQKKSGEKLKQPENHTHTHTKQPKKKERGESHEDSSSTKVNHEEPIENNKTQKKSGEKRKQTENHTEQPKKKKQKFIDQNESTNLIKNETHEESKVTDTAISKKSSLKNETNIKHSKKTKLNKNKLNKTKLKGSRSKENNNDISLLNPERLKTYGINPKKLKNKLKYGKQQ